MTMGTCTTCVPNMQGIRCGARLRQELGVHVMKQLACPVQTVELHSLGSRSVVGIIERMRDTGNRGLGLGLAKVSTLFSSSDLYRNQFFQYCRSRRSLEFSSRRSLECSISRSIEFSPVSISSRILECSTSVPSHRQVLLSGRGLGWEQPVSSSTRWSSGWSSTSRIAASPRVTNSYIDQSWVESQRLCPGCGVEMQDEDLKSPGFFQQPVEKKSEEGLEEGFPEAEEIFEEAAADEEADIAVEEKGEESQKWDTYTLPHLPKFRQLQQLEAEAEDEMSHGQRRSGRGRRKKGKHTVIPVEKPTVCARCHALRNYGKVKDESIENLLPDFDFEHVVGSRLRKAIGRRAVVLMVIDSVDFDGSFPRMAASLLAEADRELGTSWQDGQAGNVARLVIVLNKVDLLPGQISPVRLEQWVRRRSRAGGVSQISGVHIVSAFKGWGIDKLAKQVTELVGPRGDVWVIGAQNVGKSSVINALSKFAEKQDKAEREEKRSHYSARSTSMSEESETKKYPVLTEAPVPGTTLGVLKLEGILPGKTRLLDTPGLLHPHQITTRLTREEQKMVQIRKVLKPRTFRVKVGHSISVGGLMRLTIVTAPADSIYATVWASAFIPCHMGKAETVEELFEKHVGDKLQPPLGKERLEDLGRWVMRSVEVSGDRWDKSSVDVAVAGVGWIGLALSGNARLEVWTYEGVAVTVREAIVFDLALVFERPGFTPMKTSGKGKN